MSAFRFSCTVCVIFWTLSSVSEQTPAGFVLVEGGSFIMGSPQNEKGRGRDEIRHRVKVSSFYISTAEVTQEHFCALMNTPPPPAEYAKMPVQHVNWYEAVEFCNRLSVKSGLIPFYNISGTNVSCNWLSSGYRLPTEAEWEFTARGGKKSKKNYVYSGSDNADEVAWYSGNSASARQLVAAKRPNDLGVYDMSGGVNEWCNDWYGEYVPGGIVDPKGPDLGSCRVVRGGGWRIDISSCRVAYRGSLTPEHRDYSYGFRLARNAPMQKDR